MATFRFWRVSHIVDNTGMAGLATSLPTSGGSVSTLRFLTASGEGGAGSDYKPENVIDGPLTEVARPAKNAFDSSSSTLAHMEYTLGATFSDLWWLGYDFKIPREVTAVTFQARQDMRVDWGEEWQQCLVEGSSDGEVWEIVGQCKFNTPHMDLTPRTRPIIPLNLATEGRQRYWRIKDVITKESYPNIEPAFEAWRLRFLTASGVKSVNTQQAIASPSRANDDPKLKASNAFHPHQEYQDSVIGKAAPKAGVGEWWIGYSYLQPEKVVGVQLRVPKWNDKDYSAKMDWLSAKIESSDDGIVWQAEGFINYPRIGLTNSTARIESLGLLSPTRKVGQDSDPVVEIEVGHLEDTGKPSLNFTDKKLKIYESASVVLTYEPLFSPFTYIETMYNDYEGKGLYGYISGKIYERVGDTAKKVPVARRVYLYHQGSGRLIASTWSGADGVYLFKHLKVGSYFMIVSVDHTGKWGLEGAAYKQAKQVVIDGDTVQYPLK